MSAAVTDIAATGDDRIVPFAVERADVRGRIVRLGPLVDDILGRHDYPQPVSALLGEALALTALLGSALKFDGIFSLQTKSDGPVSALIADYISNVRSGSGTLRGYAIYDKDCDFSDADLSFRALIGEGHFAMTVDQGKQMDRYQGIVALDGDSLAACAQAYFQTSEQIPTAIHLAVGELFERPQGRAAPTVTGAWRAGGLLIQYLPKSRLDLPPDAEFDAPEDWRRSRMLMETATDLELTDPAIAPEKLLYQLFHEDGVRVFEPQSLKFGCRCSRLRLENVLRQYSRETLSELVENGKISANCEFCNADYQFDMEELVIR